MNRFLNRAKEQRKNNKSGNCQSAILPTPTATIFALT